MSFNFLKGHSKKVIPKIVLQRYHSKFDFRVQKSFKISCFPKYFPFRLKMSFQILLLFKIICWFIFSKLIPIVFHENSLVLLILISKTIVDLKIILTYKKSQPINSGP